MTTIPTYTFEHLKTGEVTEHYMKMSELDEFKRKNKKKLRQIHLSMMIGDPVVLGVQQPPAEFQSFLKKMRDTVPGANKKAFGRHFKLPADQI